MAHGMTMQAGEDKITKGYNSMDSMGCMLLRECTEDVNEVQSVLVTSVQRILNLTVVVADEFDQIMLSLNQIGTKVYL